MNLEQFITVFAEQFEDTDPTLIAKDTEFQKLEEWSSLTALCIIGVADENFGVRLKGDEIIGVKTVEDLYQLIQSKK